MRFLRAKVGLLALCLSSLALLALTVPSCEPAKPALSNLVMIVVDTTRADHLGCYGHGRDTSPAIDAFAAEAIRFERAYATAPWTKPTVASIFTGLFPSRHGLRTIKGALPPGLETLAELLSERGYATAGVVSHVLLDRRHGFAQGFERYIEIVEHEDPHEAISTNQVTDAAIDLLQGFDRRQPFFLFVHYFDPHYNYKRHPEYGFAPTHAGRLEGTETIYGLYDLMEDMTPEEVALVEAIYDEEIRFMDDGIGRLLGVLDARFGAEETMVLLAGDHGEEFMTHGNIGHTITLYDDVMRVPLIVRPPGYENPGVVVDQPVSLVSVFSTVLEMLGLTTDSPVQGESLVPLIDSGAAEDPSDVIFCETDEQVHKRAVIVGREKLIRDEESGKVELYDLEADPSELDDRAQLDPERVEELIAVLEKSIRWAALGSVPSEVLDLTEEQREQLRSLGYVGD